MYLLANGIIEVPKTSGIKKLFCNHNNKISGLSCSSTGLLRISGEDQYIVCADCGKILDEFHTTY